MTGKNRRNQAYRETLRVLVFFAALLIPVLYPLRGDVLASQATSVGAQGPLDGLRFAGRGGVLDHPADSEEVFHFDEGKFSSKVCLQYGFLPGVYWVRHDDEGIHFQAELVSSEHGTMRYQGVIRENRLEASMIWTKERWYWSISRNFWFEGKLISDSDNARGLPVASSDE